MVEDESKRTNLRNILGFLEMIGLQVRLEAIPGQTFLPGLEVKGGTLVVDEGRLLYPGDLLHEAGHLAVLLPLERAVCDGDAGPDAGAEMAAIGWSYAAALAAGIAPEVVFHEHGYKGGGAQLAEGFMQGRYIGVPLLAWYGMTDDPWFGGVWRTGEWVFPKMRSWLREPPAEEQTVTA